MRAAILRTLAVVGAGALVLAGVLFVASTVDGRPPTVLEVRLTQPVGDDEALALVTTSIEVVFNEPVEAAGAEAAVSLTPDVDTAASWSGSTLTITPVEPLSLDAEYTVTVADGVRDLAGNAMSQAVEPFAFATVGPPALAESSPLDGAEAVPLETVPSLTFTTLMDTASVEEQLTIEPAVPHELRWSGTILEIVPDAPLDPDTAYRIAIGRAATDVAGVPLDEDVDIEFRTVASSLEVAALVPTDGVDGVAAVSPVAILFNEAIDPATVEDGMLTIEPAIGGTLEVVPLAGDPESESGAGRALVFTPSEPLPSNTTFEVTLAPGVATADGVALGVPTEWTFTTGVAVREISNQITFLSARAGVMNVWSMNPDGSGQRQVSAELEAIVDYAVAPDGDGLVVADGRRLVFLRPDGSERRVITDPGYLDFDPTFSPDGQEIAFARADATDGSGLGLWTSDVPGGEPQRIELPPEQGAGATPGPSGDSGEPVRAPSYAPDGSAIAFVDLAGSVGILDLETGLMDVVALSATAAPIWLPDASALLVGGHQGASVSPPDVDVPVLPMRSGPSDDVFRLAPSTMLVGPTDLPTGSRVLAVGDNGSIAYVDGNGAMWLDGPGVPSHEGPYYEPDVLSAAFAPGDAALVVEVVTAESSLLELFEPETGRRTSLADGGSDPHWLP
jgi:hypothetical protein